jgi:hypothetical protein
LLWHHVRPAWPRNLDGGETAAVPPQAVWPGYALAHPADLVAVQTPARVPQRALREARARDGPHHRSDAVNLEAARGHQTHAVVRTDGRQKDVVVRSPDHRTHAVVRTDGRRKDVAARRPPRGGETILTRLERSGPAAGPGVPLRCEQARASVPVLGAQCGGARSAVPARGLPVPYGK